MNHAEPDAVPSLLRDFLGGNGPGSLGDGAIADLLARLLQNALDAGDLIGLDGAVDALRYSLRVIPANHPDRAGVLINLGLALRVRFEQIGMLADLDKAVAVSQEAVDLTPAGHANRGLVLSELGLALLARFERTSRLADLDRAVAVGQEAVDATPAGHPGLAARQTNLCLALRARYERTGLVADLDAAITAGQDAINATPAGHPDRVSMITNLSLALRARYERTGLVADLDAAITAGQDAIDATPAGHFDRVARLSNASVALKSRFERTGALADLDAAIIAARQAVDATPARHPYRAERLSNLGVALRARYERTRTLADLAAAITALQDAVEAVPADHPDKAGMLSNLSLVLRARFERTRTLADLDRAVTTAQDAVAATPDGHPRMATMLMSLGGALWARFDHTGDAEYLDAAITAAHDAVDVTPAGHPFQAGRLSSLSGALRSRFERTKTLADLDAAIAAGRKAAEAEVAAPLTRAVAAREWGHAAAVGGRWPEAVEGFQAATDLLAKAAPRSLARRDQEFLLENVGALASDAAACCVRADLPERAVELFEQGRGVLLSQALDTRTDLTILAERHPDLAHEFIRLRDDLDGTANPGEHPAALAAEATSGWVQAAQEESRQRRQTAEAFDQVIADIRAMPGFGSFLRPLPVSDLAAAATYGPVVIINASRFGSDALILTSHGLREPVPLPDLTLDRVRDQTAEFLAALKSLPALSAQRRLTAVLGWLWDAAAGPVLDQLGLTGPPPTGEPWPRLWWCVPGPLSFLPLHAAGHHQTRSDPEPQTVIDRVASSYTPTIRALIHARRANTASDHGASSRPGDFMVVAMPRTPGATDLPGAADEADMLRQRFGDRVRTFTGPDATRDSIIRALPDARWAHFACHGLTNLADPSASCLPLTDYFIRPLTVTDIARLRLADADMAFLSACSTAQPGLRLPDEAIHLASAFQLAGYRHVVATLWPIGDPIALRVARDLYAALAHTGTPDIAAVALHNVTRQLRSQRQQSPSAWASHIHIGA